MKSEAEEKHCQDVSTLTTHLEILVHLDVTLAWSDGLQA